MKRNRSWPRPLILFCLLAFQLQAWAALAIPCGHSQAGMQAATTCELHHSDRRAGSPTHRIKLLDCHKCVLGHTIGVCHPTALKASVSLIPRNCQLPRASDPHCYQIPPDRLLRPPIAAAAC